MASTVSNGVIENPSQEKQTTTRRVLVTQITNGARKKMSRNAINLIGALLLAGTTFAAGANSGNLHLGEAATVQGKQLKSGEYHVRWNGTGDTVELNITDEKKDVTTVTAHVVAVGWKNESDGHVTREENGTNTLTQIFFRGKNFELHLDDQVATIPTSSGDSSNK